MSVLNVTSGGSTGYVGGKEIWNLRIEGAYGPVGVIVSRIQAITQ